MAVESEIKVRISQAEIEPFRQHLQSAGASLRNKRSEERNLIFDYPDLRLKNSGSTVRVRSYAEKAVLTFKGPLLEDARLKKREEHETTVGCADAIQQVLEGLGLRAVFRYDKFREIWQWRLDEWDLEVVVDETPVGDFVEIEGEPEGVTAAVDALDWNGRNFLKVSYIELYKEAGLGAI